MKQNDSITEKQRETFHLLIYFEQFMLIDICVNCGHAGCFDFGQFVQFIVFLRLVFGCVCVQFCAVMFRLLTQIACSARPWTVLLVVFVVFICCF